MLFYNSHKTLRPQICQLKISLSPITYAINNIADIKLYYIKSL